jgi:cytoskeletal protein RodZ
MTLRYLRSTPTPAVMSPAKFAALALVLLAVGCNASQREPDAAIQPDSTADQLSTAEDAEEATTAPPETAPPETGAEDATEDAAAATPETVAEDATAPTPQDASPIAAGEPGYVGYPLMGETSSGTVIRYISMAPLDCTGEYVAADCDSSILVNFIETEPSDPYTVLDGQAVANCARGVLTEVIIDNDLVAYELNSPDAAMLRLLDHACEEARVSG